MSSSEDTFTAEEELFIEAIGDMIVPQAILFSDIAFTNPIQPQYCAQFLHGVWFRMFASDDEGALPAAFHFLVVGRTEAQMKSLIDGMSRCQCTPLNDDPLESGWIGAFHDYGAEALLEATAHGGFPFSLHRTISKTTVKSFEQWIHYMSIAHPWPIELLGAIGRVCRSLIVPAIVRSPTLIPTILRIAEEICDDAAPHLSPQFPRAKIIEITKRLVWRLRFIAAFFHSIFYVAGGGPDTLDKFPIERKTAIVQMCGRVIDMLRLPLVVQHAPKDRIGLIKDFIAHLTMFIDVGVSTDGVDPALVRKAIDTIDRFHGPPLTIIYSLLLAWKLSLRCYAKECEHCKIVSYCGKECQRRAWSDHKPLCKTIIKIVRDGGGDIHSKAFARNCEAGKVDFRDAEQIVAAFSLWRRTHGSVNL
ncbi:hypothetical protein K438DRAFT_1847024 [Mycena galopus ATCC 62051]|nr:hypothetical protein K438DRAFT_1847024 [Mycena galopus ATCC 62051]